MGTPDDAFHEAFTAHVFRWHFRTHCITLVAISAFDLAMAFANAEPKSLVILNSVIFDVILLFCRVLVHRWNDHERAQRVGAAVTELLFVALIATMVHDFRSFDPTQCSGSYSSSVESVMGQVSWAVLALVCAAMGQFIFSVGIPRTRRFIYAIAFLLTTVMVLRPFQCPSHSTLTVTCDIGFLFGVMIGHSHSASLFEAFRGLQAAKSDRVQSLENARLTERLEQVEREKERLAYELRFAAQRNEELQRFSSSEKIGHTPADVFEFEDVQSTSTTSEISNLRLRQRGSAGGSSAGGSIGGTRDASNEGSVAATEESALLSESMLQRLEKSLVGLIEEYDK